MINTDLSSEQAFHYVSNTKTYLMKIYFNLRSLLYFAPKDKKIKKTVRRFASGSGSADPECMWSKKAADMMQQFYKYKRLKDVFDEANEKYKDYHESIAALVPKFKHVKDYSGWKMKSGKKKERIYAFAKTANRLFDAEYNADINRLLFLRSKAMNITKEGAWNAYLKESKSTAAELEKFL